MLLHVVIILLLQMILWVLNSEKHGFESGFFDGNVIIDGEARFPHTSITLCTWVLRGIKVLNCLVWAGITTLVLRSVLVN